MVHENFNPLTYINAFSRTLPHRKDWSIENIMENGAFALNGEMIRFHKCFQN